MRWFTALLVILLLSVHTNLWLGHNGVRSVQQLQTELEKQQAANQSASLRNQRLQAEVQDLKEGLEMVEEKARSELGMLKPHEILVHLPAAKP
jgi:cell division protein FtsB